MARKPHDPTDETRAQVDALASFGVQQDDIAKYIGVAGKTLRKWYRQELDTAQTRANEAVAKSLYSQAVDDKNTTAAIFWLKSRAGWREKFDLNHFSPDGSMAPPKTIVFVSE
jgi:transposase